MASKHKHKTAIFEDGTHAVLRFDPAKPLFMEVIATFYDPAHAKDYVRLHLPAEEHHEGKRRSARQAAKGAPKRTSAERPVHTSRPRSKPLSPVRARPASEVKPKPAARTQAKPALEAKSQSAAAGVTERQTAVFKALCSLMDKIIALRRAGLY